MPEYSAGTASVRIRPNADDFVRDLKAKLRGMPDPGFRVTVHADVVHAVQDTANWRTSEERRQVEVDVDADTAGARAKTADWRQSEERRHVQVEVDADTTGARADTADWRGTEEARPVEVDVDADTAGARAHVSEWRISEEARPINIKVVVDGKDAQRQLEGFSSRQVERFRRSDVFKLNLGALAIGAVQPAAAGLTQVAAGLQQVSQAGLAVPGALAGAVTSIGTLALGLSGVKDAYDAVTKASESSGKDQAAQARAAVSAQNNLRNAVVDEVQARKDQARAYRDARQQLVDLNIEMRGGLISESRAILEAQQAREDLAKGNYSDIRDAQLRVLEADQRVLEVRSRNAQTADRLTDAQMKGVEGSDMVVAANERVVRAEQQVADAQAAAADAANKQSAAQEAAAQAMDQLSPSAQKFVRTLQEMRPAFDAVRESVQEPLFEGKSEEFREFFDSISPNLTKGLGGIGTAWNQNITALLTSLSSTQGKSIIDRILGNTGEAQSRLSAAIDPLVRGIGTLAAAGTDALPRLADAVGKVAERFARFIEAADKDGRLDKWINEGITGVTQLGNTVLNLGKWFTGLTSAAGGGGTFLQWLENVTDRWQKWTNSTEGQSKLRDYLNEGLRLLSQWGDLLKELPGAFQSMAQGVQPYVGSVIALLTTLSDLISEHPTLVKTVITAYLAWKTINPIVDTVRNSMTLLSGAVTNVGTGFWPVRDNARRAMGEVNDTFTKAGRQGSPLNKFSGALAALGGGVGAGIFGVLATVGIPAFVLAMESINKKNKEVEESTRLLNQRQLELETTLDRVTGKVTRASVEQAIEGAQNYDQTGAPGGGVEGISKGNAVRAAAALGIPEDVYGKALVGNPEAVQKVRDILLKNNLTPEINANQQLGRTARQLEGLSGGAISQDLLVRALIGDPDAVKTYTETIEKIRQSAGGRGGQALNAIEGGYTLTDIAKQLAPSGQASVLSGGALNQALQAIPGAQANVQERNRGVEGSYKIKRGAGGPFPDNAQVNASGSEAKITVPGNYEGQLQMQQIPFEKNPDGTLTATVPLNSPYIEKAYKYGGPTPSGRGKGPTGGHIVEVHDDEWVLPKSAREAVGDDALWALTKGRKMEVGGPGEDYLYSDENTNPALNNPPAPAEAAPAVHVGTGANPGPAPIAPNPMAGTSGVSSIVSKIAGGVQGPIGNALQLGTNLLNNSNNNGQGGGLVPSLGPMDAESVTARAAQVPGLIGLFGSLNSKNPHAALANWGNQTASWLADFGTKTVGSLVSSLWQGGLALFGLENSILSPSNQYNQAASGVAQFALGQEGPIGTLLGVNGSGSGSGSGGGAITDPAALAQQYGVQLDDATLAQLYGQSGDSSLLANMSPAAQRAIQYAKTHAVGQKYEYGGAGQNGFYDCSGIASAVYAAATGRPPGRYFDTESDFEALGFVPGFKPGALNIGVSRNGGGRNSHMAVTLPNGVNVESGGAHGTTAYGGPARGAQSFPLQWYLPLPEGFRDGGPTPSRKGPGPTGGYFAEVHPDEFMISARGRSRVPDSFLHALNRGLVDPKDLPKYAAGGPTVLNPQQQQAWARAQAAVRQPTPPPRPDFSPGTGIQRLNPARPAAPAPAVQSPAPTPAPVDAPPEATPAAPPSQTTPAAPQVGVPQGNAPAPSSINHNLGWVDQAISSGASTLGNLAATAISMGAAAGAAGGGVGAGAAGSLASSMVAGLFQQGGKIVSDAANVVSSFLVGNVPGSFGDPNMPAYGRIVMPEQNRPVTAPYPSRGGNTYMISGHNTNDVLREASNTEALERQAILATRRG
ncbi:tail length tape measure protein [Mycobacterium phage Sparky]|uniref:Tapemeasure n=1 Tax=Mycobacterium phage Sparky TaxID=1527493 RepID=A0A076G771_9CAUD|nr:tail length tape measure protein [Mycobacterium phage Sparky]AII28162.1 tape measure protein [Mycobacterium phage Sparky]